MVGVVFLSLALLWTITSKTDARWHGFYGDTAGKVRQGALQYEWRWGNDSFGRRELRASADGEALSGTRGYKKAPDDAGKWQLRRAKE